MYLLFVIHTLSYSVKCVKLRSIVRFTAAINVIWAVLFIFCTLIHINSARTQNNTQRYDTMFDSDLRLLRVVVQMVYVAENMFYSVWSWSSSSQIMFIFVRLRFVNQQFETLCVKSNVLYLCHITNTIDNFMLKLFVERF